MEINQSSLKKTFNYLVNNEISIFPLVSFRIAFGILMLISTIRFWYNGWIESLYLSPTFFFKYYGFHWVPAPNEIFIYSAFIILIIACINISLGLFYRISIITFFLLFTYIELIDASNYLNHYYFISTIALLLIFIPANRFFALDNLFLNKARTHVKAWQINIIKFQIGVLYFYAGLAKINADWITEALPLKIWLPSKAHLPFIGDLFTYTATAYFFSYAGLLFDLSIFFFLIYKRTRILAYLAVVFFHLMTWYLFPIGMFPFVMIASNLIFFSASSHQKVYEWILRKQIEVGHFIRKPIHQLSASLLIIFISFQLLFPLRYLLYPGELFWTEQGYRFSWRVMLMEKAGYASFIIKDASGKREIADNSLFLSPFQEKMMSTQPDFILQYAHFLAEYYTQKGFNNPEVYADVYVSLNGVGSKRFIDNTINLAPIKDSFKTKKFILAN